MYYGKTQMLERWVCGGYKLMSTEEPGLKDELTVL